MMETLMASFYYGTKLIEAWPAANPKNPDSPQPGYAVKYSDGYTSWSPKDVFEAAYQPLDALSFGHAIEALKAGHRVARAGWNGKGMWLELVHADRWSTSIGPDHVSDAHRLPWIGMKTADNGFVPWVSSQTDVLANDWCVV
jgi:hypothetical protein